jgi:hypothetical protein
MERHIFRRSKVKKASIDGLIRKSMSARARKLPGDCPDENAFAAYSEHRLSQQEIALFESHLAECDSCQNALALGMKLCDPDAAAREKAVPERKKVIFHFSIPAPVFGAAVAAIILVAVFIRFFHNPGSGKLAPTSTVEPNALVLAIEPAVPKAPLPAPIASANPSYEDKTKEQRNVPGKKEVAPLQHQEKGLAAGYSSAAQSAPDGAKAADLTAIENNAPEAALTNSPALLPASKSKSLGGSEDTLVGNTTAALMPTPASGSLGRSEDALAGDTSTALMSTRASGSPGENRNASTAERAVSLPPPPPPMSSDVGRTGGGFGMGASPSRSGGMGGGMGGAGAGGMGGFGGFGGMGGFGRVPANPSSSNAQAPKKIGDKEFYFNSGWWIDRQARYKPDDYFIEITSTDPEYESILAQYKQLRNLRPVLIYWENEFYILR